MQIKHLLHLLFVLILTNQLYASQWIQRADLPGVGRHRSCAIGFGNRGYVGLGHFNGVGFEVYFNDWWAFDPATNSWSQKANYPGNNGQGELGCHCWSFNNYIYVGLGEVEHEVLYRFHPASNTWEQLSNAPAGVIFQDTQEMVNGQFVYFTDPFANSFYRYDCTLDNWTYISQIPIPMNFTYSGFSYGGNCWIKADNTMYMYETNQNLWYQIVSAGNFPGQAVRGSAEFVWNDKFYIVGGYGTSFGDCQKEVWEFNPMGYQWTQLEDFPGTARRFSKGLVINDKAYVVTGTNGTNFNDFWEFNVTAETTALSDISVNAFPNPAIEGVQFKIDTQEKFKVILFNCSGKQLNSAFSVNGAAYIRRGNLPSGTYFYQVEINGISTPSKKLNFI